jgi:hypothetical protein
MLQSLKPTRLTQYPDLMIKTKMMWTPVTKTWMMETVIPITHHAQGEAWSTLPAVFDRVFSSASLDTPRSL